MAAFRKSEVATKRLVWGRLLNGRNFSEEKQSRHLRTDLNADGSR
jgi:hypothetical protein